MEQLASELALLQSEGQLHSQGHFTIDPQRARRLLSQYRLPTPSHYYLNAVAAAVCSRSAEVRLRLRSDSLTVSFNGQPFTPEEVARCDDSLLSASRVRENVRLRELSLTRYGAPDFRLDANSIAITRPGVGPKLLRFLGRFGRQSEEEMLLDHLVSTPDCTLFLNGIRIPALTFPQKVQDMVYWGAGEPPADFRGQGLNPGTGDFAGIHAETQGYLFRLMPGEASPGMWSGAQRAVLRAYWPGYLDLVQSGRLYRYALPARLSNCWAVFYSTALRRDLSQAFIAEADVEFLTSVVERELTRPSDEPLAMERPTLPDAS